MGIGRATEEAIKLWIAFGGVLLAYLWPQIKKKKVRDGLLIALVVIAGLNYIRYDFSRYRNIDTYDLLHYYLNTRYFEELGYFDLYPAAVLADQENGPYDDRLVRMRLQDPEEGYRRRPVGMGVARGREVREEHFTPESWASFERDFLYLQRETNFSRRNWRNLMDDRGFNATPAWLMVSAPLARLVPARSIRWLTILDLIWLLAALLVVRRAFGTRTMLWTLSFFFVTYSWRWTVPGNGFLRHDWISCLLISVSMLKMGRPYLAGFFTGYAAMMRLFPAVFLYGPVAKAAAQMLERRKLDLKRYQQPIKVVVAFLITAVVMESGAALIIGLEPIQQHAESIAEHVSPEELSSRRMGFAIAYGHEWKLRPRYITDERKAEIAAASTERLVIAVLVLLALAWGLRRSPDWETYALGFIPFFLLATASYYYFSIRAVLVVLHASDLSKLRNRVALIFLFALEVFANGSETLWPRHRVWLVGGLSQLLALYVIVMVVWLLIDARRADRAEAEPKASESSAKAETDQDDKESPTRKKPPKRSKKSRKKKRS